MKLKSLILGEDKIKYPIIQGGMGVGISLSSLAGAVAKVGGIGIISTAQIGYRESDYDKNPIEANLRAIKQELDKARAIAPKGFLGFNIMVATRYYERYIKAAVEAGADIIVSGAGLPTDLPKLVEGSKTKIAPIVSSVKSANVICKLWERHYNRLPDMVIIEGPQAGGHLGFKAEEVLEYTEGSYGEVIANIVDTVKNFANKYNIKIPVVVGGGIHSHEDVIRNIGYGADGVQVASRFVPTYECDAPLVYKEAYINAAKEDIVITKSPVGMPGRAILNPFLKRLKEGNIKPKTCHQCITKCNPATIPYCITDALVNAAKGNLDEALLFCGAKASMIEKLESVEDVIMSLMGQECI